MNLDWQPVSSSSHTVSHPVILRARLPHGWLVASEVRGGFSIAFVPDASEGADPAGEWTPPLQP